jgi:hypothetical protein
MKKTWLAWLLLLGACLTATQRREDTLMRVAREWNDDFRWGRYDIAGQAMPAEERQRFLARQQLVGDDLVMADFEVTALHFLQGSEAATVNVKIEWYRKSDPTVRAASLVQRWEVRDGHWLMITQRRVSGDRFPLVPEPVAPPAADPK